jgi:SAM-dependent methyltransferase
MSEPTPDPQEPWLALIDGEAMRGLEIGPLDKPRFAKSRYRVQYVDHASRQDLRAKYATDAAMRDHLDDIVDVDFVWSGEAPLTDVVGDAAPFDYVFASHVMEHAPDLIGWMREIAAVLDDGGRLCLAVPDKRLCFDVNRSLTEIGDLVDAYLRTLRAPSYRQIWDFHSKIVEVDAAALWAGTASYAGQWRHDLDPDQWAYELCLKHQQTGEYVDGHCQVFTPGSFLDVFAKLARLDLIDYRIESFVPSVWGTIEFRVILEKLPPSMPAEDRRAAQLASIPSFVDPVPPAPSPATDPLDSGGQPGPTELFAVTPREEALIRSKRRVINSARRLVRVAVPSRHAD